jgi:hypothetical protein
LDGAPSLASFDQSQYEELAGQYKAITDADAQCTAAANSPLANLVVTERDMIDVNESKRRGKPSRASQLQYDLLGFREVDERNKTAALAMEMFYRLSEAESGRDSLARSFTETGQLLESLKDLKDRGLEIPQELSTLERQNLELNDQRQELDQALGQLNAQLGRMLGMDVNDETPIWPEWDWTVTAPPDANVVIAQAIAHRADLGALDYLIRNLDDDTLSSARTALQRIEATMGAPLAGTGGGLLNNCFGCSSTDREVDTRRMQLVKARVELEREIVSTVRDRSQTLLARLRQVTVAAEQRISWQNELVRLRRKVELGEANRFKVGEAQLEFIAAERDLVRALVAWKVAEMKLKEAAGLLALECGFSPKPCYDCVDCGK